MNRIHFYIILSLFLCIDLRAQQIGSDSLVETDNQKNSDINNVLRSSIRHYADVGYFGRWE